MARPVFERLRSSAGQSMVLEKNIFVEKSFPSSINRDFTVDEMAEYRRPFIVSGEERRLMLTWPRQIPLDGEPAAVVEVVEDSGQSVARTKFSGLFINADVGAILIGPQRIFCGI